MNNLSEIFQDLSLLSRSNEENISIFSNFGEYCTTISNINTLEKNFLQKDVKEFFKYIRLEYDEVDKLFSDYKYAKINFEGCENNIISQLDTPVISQCLQGAEQLTYFFMLP